MKKLLYIFVFFFICSAYSQIEKDSIFTLSEYLGYVKKYHPIVKQAKLITSLSESKLLKARGGFDPKIEVDYDRKKFKETEYYDKLNTVFKIPTWYGIEFKANYERNSGQFLNPEFSVPDDGLYSAGVSFSLAQGLLTNKRMATLKKARLYTKQARADQQLVVNDILYKAITIYFKWLQKYQIHKTYKEFLVNADVRLENVKKSFKAGDKPAIDTLEASINYKNRLLDLEKANINYLKSKLELANYLWLNNNIPLELETTIVPDKNTFELIDTTINNSLLNMDRNTIENHPKIQSLEFKKESLLVNKRLQLNNLLPKIDVQYNFLTTENDNLNSLNTSNYKAGVSMSFPLFLRKERADLKIAKIKLQDIDFSISSNKVSLTNKIKGIKNEIISYNKQYNILNELVFDYEKLVNGEERKFILGEGSIFLINYREVKLIETKLKLIGAENNYLNSKGKLFQLLNSSF